MKTRFIDEDVSQLFCLLVPATADVVVVVVVDDDDVAVAVTVTVVVEDAVEGVAIEMEAGTIRFHLGRANCKLVEKDQERLLGYQKFK